MALSFYGRTYWDLELKVDLNSLSQGKGKFDLPLEVTIGGFPCNAARAAHGLVPQQENYLVTLCAHEDLERVRRALPATTTLEPIVTEHTFPDFSVIINPASDCRILRDPGDDSDPRWHIRDIPAAVWAAELHVLGRVPQPFVRALVQRVEELGKRVAWCGGDALPPDLEARCHLLCVNYAEAGRLLGDDQASSTLERASALAARAKEGALRMVTGRGNSPTIVAERAGHEIRTYECVPLPIARDEIVGLLGVGDAFATTFLVCAYFDAEGGYRQRPDIEAGLAAARQAASHFITHPRPRGGRHD